MQMRLHVIIFVTFLTFTVRSQGEEERGGRGGGLRNQVDALPALQILHSSPHRENEQDVTLDPEGSWINFVKRSRSKRKPRRRGEKTNRAEMPHGGIVTAVKEDGGDTRVQEVVRDMIRQEVNRQTHTNSMPCIDCLHNVTLRSLPPDAVAPRISVAFSIKLKHNAPIREKTRMELRTYYMPYTPGTPQRGTQFNVKHGRFVAPLSGVYHMTSALHVAHDGYKQRRPRKLRRTERVEATLCIDSNCSKYNSIVVYSGLESNSRTFTISLTGLLELKAGQYVSVFVDNESHHPITVLKESTLSGVLLGG